MRSAHRRPGAPGILVADPGYPHSRTSDCPIVRPSVEPIGVGKASMQTPRRRRDQEVRPFSVWSSSHHRSCGHGRFAEPEAVDGGNFPFRSDIILVYRRHLHIRLRIIMKDTSYVTESEIINVAEPPPPDSRPDDCIVLPKPKPTPRISHIGRIKFGGACRIPIPNQKPSAN
jgi:hypothetical protein